MYSNSRLVVNQYLGSFEEKYDKRIKYLKRLEKECSFLNEVKIEQIYLNSNCQKRLLIKLNILLHHGSNHSLNIWLKTLSMDKTKENEIISNLGNYLLQDVKLYKRTPLEPNLSCVTTKASLNLLKEAHKSELSSHSRGRKLV